MWFMTSKQAFTIHYNSVVIIMKSSIDDPNQSSIQKYFNFRSHAFYLTLLYNLYNILGSTNNNTDQKLILRLTVEFVL